MLPTAFAGPEAALDLGSTGRVARQYLADGCDGLVVLGVIGEPTTLGLEEKRAVCEAALATGAPVIAAAVTGGYDGILGDLHAVIAPVAPRLAGVMVPVLYADEERLGALLDTVRRVTGLPVLVQDLPRSTGVHVDIDVLAEVVSRRPWVRGVKCEAPPTYDRIARLAARGVPGLMSGFGGLGLVADLASGASAVAIGVTVPDAIVAAGRYWTAGDDETAQRCIEAWASRIHLETQEGASIAIRKRHLLRQGLLEEAIVREPTLPWSPTWQVLSDAAGV
jgi:4-hydroxy-tetrahydrodipicolinate synthase